MLNNDDITLESYLDFLQGKYFSTNMTNIIHKNVLLNISNYVERYWIEWRNGTSKLFTMLQEPRELFRSSYSGFWLSSFYNCYSLQIPGDKAIMVLQVELKTTIFPLGVRDRNYSTLTLVHTQNQLLTAGQTLKFMFPVRKANDSYAMRFKIKGVEMIKRRNKRSKRCHENWENYDSAILEEHARRVGCTPPYHDPIDNIPVCSTKDQIKESVFNLRFDGYGTHPPCEGIEKIYYSFEEDDMEGTAWEKRGYFWLGPFIYDPKFKEIVQKRVLDLHGLIGYIGGYIGLFLGYSIIQIPDFISVFARKFESYLKRNRANEFKENDVYVTKII